ncbi:helix-turn-helix domain-containing protein [Kitasatospora sp. McL0602]|uniref:helix-turn-helix domain-containing protein n=1 Tax=Kitasatospora sp. McL0602 TaxID=3439530 RepID=UPI003F893C19
MRRRNNGEQLRSAMRAVGLTIPRLAEATRNADPLGVGISPSLIGFLVSTGKSGRNECSDRTAELISLALDVPIDELFLGGLSVVADSTSTSRDEMQATPPTTGPEPLMTAQELLRYLRKSANWLDIEIRERRIEPIYVGRSRRFDRLQVLSELKAAATVRAA